MAVTVAIAKAAVVVVVVACKTVNLQELFLKRVDGGGGGIGGDGGQGGGVVEIVFGRDEATDVVVGGGDDVRVQVVVDNGLEGRGGSIKVVLVQVEVEVQAEALVFFIVEKQGV